MAFLLPALLGAAAIDAITKDDTQPPPPPPPDYTMYYIAGAAAIGLVIAFKVMRGKRGGSYPQIIRVPVPFPTAPTG